MKLSQLTHYSPKLWELVGVKIKKNSALYRWLNSDQGQIIGEGKVFWVERFGTYCQGPSEKAFAQLKTIMKETYGAEYLYDRFPIM